MKTYRRFVSLILALLLCCTFAVSCSNPASDEDTSADDAETTAAEVAETELSDDIEPMDFKGYEFQILSSVTTSQHAITVINEQTGDVLNDAMYNRTQDVAEKYNITFLDDYLPGDAWKANTVYTNSVIANDQAYDLAMLLERSAFSMTDEEYFWDLRELEYINLEKPYWNQAINEAINLTDAMYITYGSAQICLYDLTFVLCFNQEMITDLQLESPFDLVLEGTWTLDKMYEMASAAKQDADGDGVWGENDVYGIEGAHNSLPMSFISAARQRTIEETEDNGLDIRLLTNPMLEEILTTITAMCWEPGFCYQKPLHKDTYFHIGQSLFSDSSFYNLIGLRDMEADFGIVPFPKYTDSQQEYGVFLSAGTRAMVVPITAAEPELSGAVLETLHFLSYKDVMPAYYEVTLKEKVSRDHISSQMLDLIIDSIYYDLGWTIFCDYLKDPIFSSQFKENKNAYVSTVTQKLPELEKAIAEAYGEK